MFICRDKHIRRRCFTKNLPATNPISSAQHSTHNTRISRRLHPSQSKVGRRYHGFFRVEHWRSVVDATIKGAATTITCRHSASQPQPGC